MMYAKSRSSGQFKAVEGGDDGELYCILCGQTASGDIVPVLVDADGKIITTTSG